jgi:hypothetical protein
VAERGLDRLAVVLLEGLGKQLWGFPPRLMSCIVAEMGPVRAVGWLVRNMPRYERTVRVLGPLRTHLACTVISLYNGCRYCSYGHAYAVELNYLKERDRVFPVDAETISGWLELGHTELRDRMCDVLQRADLHVEVLWVDRTLALATGQHRAMDQEEARIAHLVQMFGALNAIGMAGKVEPDEAHDPLNKDRSLKMRNTMLRESAA